MIRDEAKRGKVGLGRLLGESYVSLALGAIVVIVIAVGLIIFYRTKATTETSSTKTDISQEKKGDAKSLDLPKTYTVAPGDNLWNISEKLYKSGYNWVDVAKENSLEDPDVVFSGMVLRIPDVEPKVLTVKAQEGQMPNENAITKDAYTVVEGDNLWEISVRAYGDGFRWVELARVNTLGNPDLIFPGNKLKITR